MLAHKRAVEGPVITVTNVKVCKRIGGEGSILVCERCYNEVEGSVSEYYAGNTVYSGGIEVRYDFCPWCSAPLREGEDLG